MRLAKRYYAKLYREYAIVDLSRYKVSPHGIMTVHSPTVHFKQSCRQILLLTPLYPIGICARSAEVISNAILYIQSC